jgi:1-acyl-sn-glycerol-3-phosphate acyltransferase
MTSKVWQRWLVVVYFLICTVYVVGFSWLLLIPRYRRERTGARYGLPGWIWLTNAMLFRAHGRILGAENLPAARHGFLYVANHESVVDIWLLMHFLRPGFLMKQSLLVLPVGWGAYFSGSVGVRRGDKQSRAQSLDETLAMSRRSTAVVVFPEGTFGHPDGRLLEPHLNALRHAHDAGLPVVPLAHAGCRRCLDGDTLPFRPGAKTVLVVRPMMRPTDYPDREAFAAACWHEVIRGVRLARRELAPGWPYESDPAPDVAP